jgi:hypothetical protein
MVRRFLFNDAILFTFAAKCTMMLMAPCVSFHNFSAADDTLNMPFYKLSTEPSDKASVKIEEAGHYCLSFIEKPDLKSDLLPIIFDSSKIFGMDTTLEKPAGLSYSTVDDILSQPQYGWAKTSSAFAAATKVTLKPGENITIASVYGKANAIATVPQIASLITAPNFVSSKFNRARGLINDLTAGVDTETVNPLFDGTVRQMYVSHALVRRLKNQKLNF